MGGIEPGFAAAVEQGPRVLENFLPCGDLKVPS
jgi:hypothetical protein